MNELHLSLLHVLDYYFDNELIRFLLVIVLILLHFDCIIHVQID